MKRTSRSLRLISCLVAGLFAGLVAGHAPATDDLANLQSSGQSFALPDFGSSADTLLSTGEEHRLGRAFMQSVRKSLSVIDEPFLADYIATLGQRLVEAGGYHGQHFHFFLIDDKAINAFAGPDGHIGVYSGLLLAAETESELAAVIAHEIAHVTQRHLVRAFEDTQKMSLPATALLIGAAILASQVSSDAGAAAITGIQAATLQRQINFTRHNEKEADRVGIKMLAAAGFNPFAMAGIFERLAKSARLNEDGAPEMLRTHPVTTDRISDALGRAEDYGLRLHPDRLSFHLTRADLRQRSYRRPEQAIAYFRATLREGRYANVTAERYGYSLALMRDGQIAEARRLAESLLTAHPDQGEFIVLGATLAQQSGGHGEALKRLGDAYRQTPTSLPLRMAYAEALIKAGQAQKALRLLEPAARVGHDSPDLYALLTRAAIKANDRGATFRYRAERHYVLGDLDIAIHQLKEALRQEGLAYHEAASLQARLDVLRAERQMIESDPWND